MAIGRVKLIYIKNKNLVKGYILRLFQSLSKRYIHLIVLRKLIFNKKDLDIHKEVYTEYIPVLEDFLTAIIDDKGRNYWRIHDALKLLLEMDEPFVQKILTEKGKTLADFGLDGEEND